MPSAPRRELARVIPLVTDQRLQVVTHGWLGLGKAGVWSCPGQLHWRQPTDDIQPVGAGLRQSVHQRGLGIVVTGGGRRRGSWTVPTQQGREVIWQWGGIEQGQKVDVAQQQVAKNPHRVPFARYRLLAGAFLGDVGDQSERLLASMIECPHQDLSRQPIIRWSAGIQRGMSTATSRCHRRTSTLGFMIAFLPLPPLRIAMHRTPAYLLVACFAVASAQAQAPAQQTTTTSAPAPTVDEAMKALRADMQSSRADIMAKNLTLTADQAAKFWPVFNAYQKEQNAIMDDQLKGVQKYVDSSQTLDDAGALALMRAHFDRDAKMNALRQKWLGEFQKVLPTKLAVRAMQIDRRLSLATQMEIASRIPLVH